MRTFFLTILIAVPALAQNSIFPDKATRDAAKQLEPAELSAESRIFLKGKMKLHIKDMRDLSIAVAVINMAEVQRLAQGVANAPRLDRNMGPASLLPERFFDLQDELKKNAQTLSDAGKANDAQASLAAYQQLVSTCVTCHATFKAQVQQAPPKK